MFLKILPPGHKHEKRAAIGCPLLLKHHPLVATQPSPGTITYCTLSPGNGARTSTPLPSRCAFSSAGVPVNNGNVP